MNIQNRNARAFHAIYTGMSGTGKTTLCAQTVIKAKARWKFVFDGKGGEIARDYNLPACYTGDDLLAAIERGGWVVFNPMKLYEGRFKTAFDFFLRFAWKICTSFPGEKCIWLDEVNRWTYKHKSVESYQTILDLGRTFGVKTFSISTRANAIYTEHRAAYSHVFAFRNVDKNAVEFLNDAGIDPEAVRNLKNGEYLWRNVDTGEEGKGGKAF